MIRRRSLWFGVALLLLGSITLLAQGAGYHPGTVLSLVTATPPTCTPSDAIIITGASPVMKVCTAADTWSSLVVEPPAGGIEVTQGTTPWLVQASDGAQVAQGSQGDPGSPWYVNLRDAASNELLGQQVMAASIPVTIASNQSAVPVSGTFWQATQPVSGTVAATQSGAWSVAAAAAQSGSWTVAASQSGVWNIGAVSGLLQTPGNSTGSTAGPLMLGAATTTAQAYTNATMNYLSLTTFGALRIEPWYTGNQAAVGAASMNSTGVNAPVSIVSAQFDDTSPTAITENQFGFARFSANRNFYTTLRDAAGNERGVNVSAGNALLTDASATTQPVSITAGNFPDNEPFNVAQINGVTPLMGNGASGTGALRMTLANDSTGVLAGVTNLATIGTSIVPGTAATHLGKAEDAAHGSGDTGVATWGVRNEAASQFSNADGEYTPHAVDAYGVGYAILDHPKRVRCTITSTATTSTLITGCAAPGAGLSIYITSINWSSSIISTTANFMRLQSGTGGSCGTGTAVLYDGFTQAAFGNQSWTLNTPIKVAANSAVCFVHASAGTRLVNLTGYIAP